MLQKPVYIDNHATTRVDPRVVEAMLPFFTETYGNAGSISHCFGWEAQAAVDTARADIAGVIGATAKEIVFTSGATESNNLALRGLAERPRSVGKHIVTVCTEHKAILDPAKRLARRGFEVTHLHVAPQSAINAGVVDLQELADSIRDDTLLVSVMLANNEIGVLQPLAEIGALCRSRGVLLHSDATQAVGKIPVDVAALQIDLMSFTAHKIYGPKGVGALYVRRGNPRVRLEPLQDGGGQENGRRSGTLNTAGMVGFAKALKLCQEEGGGERNRLAAMRNRLAAAILAEIPDVSVNGPPLAAPELRLAGNLSCCFENVDGEALMMSMRDLAVSSGSACTSANPEPSHVLRALGLSDEQTRASLRFGLGRFNTDEEIDFAIETVKDAVRRLRAMGSAAH